MIVSRLCRTAVAAAAVVVLATAAHAYSNEAVKDAQALLELVQRRFATGSANEIDVAQAQAHLLTMRLKAKRIGHAAYCAAALPVELKIVTGIEEKMRTGQRPLQDLFEAKSRWYALKADCRKN